MTADIPLLAALIRGFPVQLHEAALVEDVGMDRVLRQTMHHL